MPGLYDLQKPLSLEVEPRHKVACFLHDPQTNEFKGREEVNRDPLSAD